MPFPSLTELLLTPQPISGWTNIIIPLPRDGTANPYDKSISATLRSPSELSPELGGRDLSPSPLPSPLCPAPCRCCPCGSGVFWH